MGGWWISSRSGWLLEFLTELTKAILLKSEQNKSLAVDAGRKIIAMLSKKYLLANIMAVIPIYISKEE